MVRQNAGEILLEKLEVLRRDWAICSDKAQRFTLKKQIEDTEEDLRRLSASGALNPATPGIDISKYSIGGGDIPGREVELAALLEALRDKGLVLLPASALIAAATGTLTAAATDAAPLPDADLADLASQQIAKDLARIRERYLSGERAAAIAEFGSLLSHPARSHLAASLRGRMLRTAALYRLGAGQDRAQAEALAGRASRGGGPERRRASPGGTPGAAPRGQADRTDPPGSTSLAPSAASQGRHPDRG